MILLIDNYDSLPTTYISIWESLKKTLRLFRNDKVTIEEIEQLNPDRIVLSPGLKKSERSRNLHRCCKTFYQKKPILGICLGHQSIGAAFGAEIVHAKELMHGKQSLITQDGRGIFEGIPSPVHVARYHSLAVDEKTLPDVFEILARTEDGEIMAMQHKEYPLIGIQFHPESIYTDHGKKMIENFEIMISTHDKKR